MGMVTKAQITENRTVSGYSKVNVQDGVQLIYEQNEKETLVIKVDNAESLGNLVTEVKNGELKIYLVDKKKNDGKSIAVSLTAPGIHSFVVGTAATITINSPLYTENFNVDLSSGAEFRGSVIASRKIIMNTTGKGTELNLRTESESLEGSFKSNSRVNLCGKTENATIYTSQNALCAAKNLLANKVTVAAEGSSIVFIHTKDKININVEDAAKVTYIGSPELFEWNENAYATSVRKSNNQKEVTVNYNNKRSSSKNCFNQEKSK